MWTDAPIWLLQIVEEKPQKPRPREVMFGRRLANHTDIMESCSWYRNVVVLGAATCDETNWYAGASITSQCANGEQIFHDYSSKHPTYSEKDAQAKFNHAKDDAGPRTCKNIEENLAHDGCSRCPYHGEITSPIQLGHKFIYDPGKEGPIPLGYTKDGAYALRDPVRSIIIQCSANQLLSAQYLLGLAPSEFWARQFPAKKQQFDAYHAGEALIAICRKAGPFNPHTIRGRGIWIEDGKVVVNLGDPLPDGLKFHYLCFERIDLSEKSVFDAQRLRRFVGHFNWRNEADAMLMFGWLALAPICGVLMWRPHLFIYGPPRCGKTTIHATATTILTPLVISTDGQSSEAGIRQTLGPDSLAIIIDEFESDHWIGQIKGIIRLARSASSADTQVLRGTPEGKAMQFSLRTTFLFAAVNPTGLSPADESRIVLLELKMHNNDKAIAQAIAEDESYFRSIGPAWSAYMVSLAQHIPESVSTLEAALPGLDKRHRQNMATLLAGAFVALNRRAPTKSEAEQWAEEFTPTITTHAEALERDDAAECLEHLLCQPIDGYPLGHWLAVIEVNSGSNEENKHVLNAGKVMQMYGITFLSIGDERNFVVSNSAPLVERAFLNTTWTGRGWQRALRKLDGAIVPSHPVYFPHLGHKARGTAIPTSYLPEPIEIAAVEDKKEDGGKF